MKQIFERKMVILSLLSLFLGNPAIAAISPQKPLAQRVDATLCDAPAPNVAPLQCS
jgi:hypothetical protein